jgi:hypothetical protein
MHRVNNGFKPIVRAKFLVDMVYVITQRGGTNSQIACNFRGSFALSQLPQNANFLLRQSCNWKGLAHAVRLQ